MTQELTEAPPAAHVAPTVDGLPRAVELVVVTVRADTADGARLEQRLSEALARRGVVLLAATDEGNASCAVTADVKSSFVLDVWQQVEVPVLWLDVDADVEAMPLLTPSAGTDFAAHDRSRQHRARFGTEPDAADPDLAPGYLWFGRSAAAADLLADWVRRCADAPAATEVAHLARAWSEHDARGLVTEWMPAGSAGFAGSDATRGAALGHARSLFERRSHPYYVVISDYRENSAGVWAVHGLCHALNSAGYEAYIVGTSVVNPQWDTPVLTQQQSDAHAAAGLEPIVVYPEVVTGNPLKATTVVRYVLNVPGFFTGEPMEESPDDLLFYYSPQFVGDTDPETVDYLMAPTIDPMLFRPDPTRVRDKVLVYSHRFPVERIDMTLFPPGAEVLSMSQPLPLPELARLFQSTKVLYSYELSGTCTMAMACGCPVVYRREGGLAELPSTFLLGDNGAAMADEEDALERATRTVEAVPAIIAGMEQTYWEQLTVFVRKTQQVAASRSRRG